MRLIDAEPIEKYIEDGLNCKDPKKRFGHDAIEIMTEIHYAPTITPPPNDPLALEELQEMDGRIVKRGHWINAYINRIHHYRCSVCGEYIELVWTENFEYSFCPNCGAKMDSPEAKPKKREVDNEHEH